MSHSSVDHHCSSINHQQLLSRLLKILPVGSVLHESEDLRPYECDALAAYRQLPLMVVLPDSVEQVQQILRLCHEINLPVVARGAGTGLSGGALPNTQGLLLSMAKFKNILAVDQHLCLARVQPGVRNLAISQAAEQYDLYYAPDPSSQIACTIGGNVAENSGGVHCLKYGLTVHNIQQLKILTIEGELITIGGSGLDSPGYDLLALMTGSEGMLGIIIEVTVKLLVKPECVQTLLAAFDNIAKAANAVADIIAAGIIPAGLEMMDKLAVKAAEDFVHAGYPEDAEAILLCELDGTQAQVQEELDKACKVLSLSGAIDVQIAKTELERKKMWAGRKSAFPAVGRISPDYYCMDGTIPRRYLAKVLKRIEQLAEYYGLVVANVFHAGDGNLHPLIMYDANEKNSLEKTEKFGADILKYCVKVGGVLTGEHGVGVEKRELMCEMFNNNDIQQQIKIKKALDASSLLNPGIRCSDSRSTSKARKTRETC